MAKRIFFPLLENNNLNSKIAEHFGHAPFLGVYDFETNKIEITQNFLDHSDKDTSPVKQIINKFNPNIVFAKFMGKRAIQLFKNENIELKCGDFDMVCDVLENIDKLSDLTQDCGH